MPSNNHPLPPPPGPAQQVRPRAKSNFSFRSNHSRKSSSGSNRIDLIETHDEKESRRLHTKADPTMAIQEAEPSAVASGVKASLASIRDIQHKDSHGNIIADPDRSNPSRSRWERPLDTIRSFEAAIDGNYSRKTYIPPPESASNGTSHGYRRNSYYGTQVSTDDRSRYGGGGYYAGGGGQRTSYRSDNYMDNSKVNGNRSDGYHYNNNNNNSYGSEVAGPSNGYYPNRARYPRTASEPQFNPSGIYGPNGNHHSYETVTTASGSGASSGEPAAYTTEPSSDNSSMDRNNGPPGKEPQETYGIGFGNTPSYAPVGSGINAQYGQNGGERRGNGYPQPSYQNRGAASVPRTQGPSVPIKLGTGTGSGNGPTVHETQNPVPEKRRSWFGRRLSKRK